MDCVELEKPVPGPGQALIRIKTAGICGSDIGAFRGTNKLVSYPRIIGHELAGILEEVPADNPKGLKPGDKVIVDPYLYCGKCYPCSIGRTNCCTDLKVLGVHIDGGMAEYFCHPADMLVKMPEDMDWTDAAMAEPLTISLHGIHRGGLKAGEYCAIIGAGPIGLLAGMIAQAYGAHAILLDLVQERLDFAKELINYVSAGKCIPRAYPAWSHYQPARLPRAPWTDVPGCPGIQGLCVLSQMIPPLVLPVRLYVQSHLYPKVPESCYSAALPA